MGVTDADSLKEKRPYIIVGAFVIGMLLTPPDVISQIMLALPMWLLFEVGIIMSKVLIVPDPDEEEEDDDEGESHITYDDVKPAKTSSSTKTATTAAAATAATEAESATPTGYSAAAYPDDYEPLTWEELEEEMDKASEWEDENDDDDDEEDDDSPGMEYSPKNQKKTETDTAIESDSVDGDTSSTDGATTPAEDGETTPAETDTESSSEDADSDNDTKAEASDKPEADEATPKNPNYRDTEDFLDDLKKRYPDEDGSVA